MAFALNFDEKLCQRLNELAPKYHWEAGWSAKGEGWRVDIAGLTDKIPRVLVEVELKKDNPVENVVKIWRWASQEKKTKPILFLHAFSAHYHRELPATARPTKAKQYDRAVFIGDQMTKDETVRLDYKPLRICSTTREGKTIPFTPRMRRGSVIKEGGAAMHRAAEQLAADIARLLPPISRR